MKSARRIAEEIADKMIAASVRGVAPEPCLTDMIEEALKGFAAAALASQSNVQLKVVAEAGTKQERARMTAALKGAGVGLLPRFFENLDSDSTDELCGSCDGTGRSVDAI